MDENFEKVVKELEELNLSYSVPRGSTGYENVWAPGNNIKMWSVPRRSAELLRQYVLDRKAKTILELGTSSGYSTIWLASAAKENDGKVYTIEIAKPKIAFAQKYIKEAGLDNFVEIIEGDIDEVLKSWDKPIDLAFLDADKVKYKNYLEQIELFLNKGAVVIADNVTDYGYLMPDYLSYVKDGGKYDSTLLQMDNGLMVSVKL